MITPSAHRQILGLGTKPSLVKYLAERGAELNESEWHTAQWIDHQDSETVSNIISIILKA